MKLSDLKYTYPEELIATRPSRPSRVMWVEGEKPVEITIPQLLEKIPAGDVLVINNTKVLKRRIFADDQTEILFLDRLEDSKQIQTWSVLFPAKKYSVGDVLSLPGGFELKLIEKGRPQVVQVSPPLHETDFEKWGELPLPPYIQHARGQRHNVAEDQLWYQTAWASRPGSQAAPTASLHLTNDDLNYLRRRGVQVVELTLHVGLGTFLPVYVEDLDQHQMHSESYEVTPAHWQMINNAKKMKHKIWALGTTSARVLESVARTQKLFGETDILLQVGSEFKMVDRLMTNFHQPESTLLAMVAGFSGLVKMQSCYAWAIEKKFKLFSYGDFSVWLK